MSNILDYLDWFGDLPLEAVPFNEVDNLILSQAAYLDLGLLGADGESRPTVADVADAFFREHPKEELYSVEGLVSPLTPFVLQRMAAGRRFSQARVRAYREVTLPEEREQFAAVTFDLSDGTSYVGFRGTDDSLLGWHEDFILSFRTAPAQTDAVSYLQRIAAADDRPLRVGGHSKGGNLAAYAVAMADDATAERVIEVWCNDSPGFDEEVCPASRLAAIAGRTHLIVPGYCVVGRVLGHGVEPEVVVSEGDGVMQHSGTSWQVLGPRFVRADGFAPASDRMGTIIDGLLTDNDPDSLERLTEETFDCLYASGEKTVSGLLASGTDGLGKVISAVQSVDEPDRTTLYQMLLAMLGQALSDAMAPVLAPLERAATAAAASAAEDGGETAPAGDPTDGEPATAEAALPEGISPGLAELLRPDTPPSVDEMLEYRERRRREELLAAPVKFATRLAAGMSEAAEKGFEAARARYRAAEEAATQAKALATRDEAESADPSTKKVVHPDGILIPRSDGLDG